MLNDARIRIDGAVISSAALHMNRIVFPVVATFGADFWILRALNPAFDRSIIALFYELAKSGTTVPVGRERLFNFVERHREI